MRKLITKKEADIVLDILSIKYPNPVCELVHSSPFELLVSTILSAQCTDKRVNMVTKDIYPRYNTAKDFKEIDIKELENLIKSCGFYKNKAKNIKAMATILDEKYGGEVPKRIEVLTTLPGVGKKTANVVASNSFGVPAIAVDTHVFRLSNRIGFVDEKTVENTEEALQRKIKKSRWTEAHHLMIHHGRYTCFARNPNCTDCPITDYCRFFMKEGKWRSV